MHYCHRVSFFLSYFFALSGTMVQHWYQQAFLGRNSFILFLTIKNVGPSIYSLGNLCDSLPPLHKEFDLPAPFVLHTDCPHYWRFHLPGDYLPNWVAKFIRVFITFFFGGLCPKFNMQLDMAGETEEEFSTRLANNLENLILKEGPDTVKFSTSTSSLFVNLSWQEWFVWWPNLYDCLFQIAAFIAEPVMGAGGVIPPPATYFDKVNSWGSSNSKLCFKSVLNTCLHNFALLFYLFYSPNTFSTHIQSWMNSQTCVFPGHPPTFNTIKNIQADSCNLVWYF